MVATGAIQQGRINEAQLGYAPNGAIVADGLHILFDGTPDEFVLAFQPATTNQSVRSTLVWQEFS
jgi:hypothetical protein